MTLNTKHEILNYLMKKTMDSDMKNINQFSANVLSKDLNISRSLASQYLNSFVKEGTLIKIASRPVYFLSKKMIEEQFQIELLETLYYSVEDFIEALSHGSCVKHNFMKMIGYDASLRNIIDQVKAALKYPYNGLPVILYGEKGVGKSLLCHQIYEYGLEHHIFPEYAKFMKFKIMENTMDVVTQLLGTDAHIGLLEQCNGGILYLKQAQFMNAETQQRLTKILEDGQFTPINSSKQIKLKARIILAVDEDYQKCFDYDLIQCFPVVCHLPNLDERYTDEKEELIISLFKSQALILNKHIYVSKNLIHILMSIKYKRNIDELCNVVEDICARANSISHDATTTDLYVKIYQLPEYILMELKDQEFYHEDKVDYVDILSYKKSEESEKLTALFDTILNRFVQLDSSVIDIAIKESVNELSQYYSIMAFNEKYTNPQSKAMEQTISNVLNKVLSNYNMSIPFHCCPLFAYGMSLSQSGNSILQDWQITRRQDISKCLILLEKRYPQGALITEKIKFALLSNLEVEFDDINKIILLINIAFYNEGANKNKYLSIIIAHGYATASSMAEAVNTLLGTYVFDAFDMPLDTSMLDVVERLKRYINRYTIKNDILLLVDMGSLEHIDEHLLQIDNKNIGIINNVSTRLALEVGEQVLQDCDMESLLAKTAKNSISTYSFVENKQKRDSIIFLSDNGIKMANRMKDLFVSSLPKTIDLEIITIALKDYKNKDYMHDLEENFTILFYSGICTSIDQPKQFISIEEIITSNQLDFLSAYLNKYLTVAEIDELTRNLIHNFSLENALNSLSILDAKKLLGFVEGAVNQMQLQLQRQFYGNTIAGLYLHMCCMIERLVTKEPLSNREGLEIFEKEHKKFIDIVKRCFTNIGNHYGVEISLSEISYLYDYIQEDKEQLIGERDF